MWYLWDFVKRHLKVMIIFRWQAHDSRVEIGVSPQWNNNFSHQGLKKIFDFWHFHLVWFENARFASAERAFLTSGRRKNLEKKSDIFGVCVLQSNLQTASFSLNTTSCRSKSSNSARFHTWSYVSTYRSMPIWTSLDSSDLSEWKIEISEACVQSLKCNSDRRRHIRMFTLTTTPTIC